MSEHNTKVNLSNRKAGFRNISISILNYLILTILIAATVLTLSSDFIPLLRKRVSEEPVIPLQDIQNLEQPLIKNAIEEALKLKRTKKEEIKPIFPHKSPFEIYVASIDVISNVYEGEFSKDSELEKLIMLKELSTIDGGKFPLIFPGEEGTCVIAGHHLRSGELFGALEHIKEGDDVIVTSSDSKVILTYKVSNIIPYSDKNSPAEIFIAEEGESKLILFTCSYRLGKPKSRFIVVCELVDIEEKTNDENS